MLFKSPVKTTILKSMDYFRPVLPFGNTFLAYGVEEDPEHQMARANHDI